jgi:hypothetical protein
VVAPCASFLHGATAGDVVLWKVSTRTGTGNFQEPS